MTNGINADTPIAVIGAGTMGTGIALLAATAGHQVLLFDANHEAVDRSLTDLQARLERSVERGRHTAENAERILGNVVGCGWLAECAPAGFVIEAVVEDLEVKRSVLAEIEGLVADDTILATNTSSLSVTAIAAALQRPGQFVGTHFFNPAPIMPLVEIILGTHTDREVADAAADTVAAWGKSPVRCASAPGSIVNRVARPFYGEALRLVAEGAADYATIDAVMAGSGGFRMGPFTLMDLIGLDVNLAVSKSVFAQSFNDARFAPHVLQQSLVDAGLLGRKSGAGFFPYHEGAQRPDPATMEQQPAPTNVEAHGALGWASGLVDRLLAAGVEVDGVAGGGPGHLIFEGVHLVPTDGRTATSLAADGVFGSDNIVVFDLVHDWASVNRVGIAAADQAERGNLERAAALFQAIGCEVSPLDDTHGLVVMRTVAQLVAMAVDTAAAGVATGADIDKAMKLGTNYPSGPLEWADRIGAKQIAAVLQNLHIGLGEDRYRLPPMLARRAAVGRRLRSYKKNGSKPGQSAG